MNEFLLELFIKSSRPPFCSEVVNIHAASVVISPTTYPAITPPLLQPDHTIDSIAGITAEPHITPPELEIQPDFAIYKSTLSEVVFLLKKNDASCLRRNSIGAGRQELLKDKERFPPKAFYQSTSVSSAGSDCGACKNTTHHTHLALER